MKLKMQCKLLAMSLALCFAVTSCTTQPKPVPVRITLMHGWGGSAQDHVEMREIYNDFAKQNPDIELLYDSLPDITVVIDKANDMLAVDKMPDIISTNGSVGFLDSVMFKGKAADLSPYINSDADFAASIGEELLNTWRQSNGEIYTLPDALEAVGYWYNEDVFKAAGITDTGTPEGSVQVPRTWPDFWQACDAIAATQDETGVVPMYMQTDQMRILFGARLAAKDNASRLFMQGGKTQCDPRDVTATVDDLIRAAKYNQGEPLRANDVRAAFLDGKSAIYFNGVWANTELGQATTGQSIKYAAFPSESGQPLSFVSPPSGYVVSSDCSPQQLDACVRFLKYMFSEQVQKRIVVKTRQAPSSPQISTKWIAQQVPVLGEALDVCYGADVKILSLYRVLNDKQNTMINESFDIVMENHDISPQVFIDILSSNINK